MAARNPGNAHRRSDSARGTAPTPGVFAVFIVAGIIALLAIVDQGKLSEGAFLALLVFLVIGSLAPPVAVALGIVMIVAIMMRGAGTKLFAWLGGLPNQKQTAQAKLPSSIGGPVVGYQSNGQPIAGQQSTVQVV